MAKVIPLIPSTDPRGQVWGIAAQTPIWRIGYFVNEVLEIHLKRVFVGAEEDDAAAESETIKKTLALFDPATSDPFLYEDGITMAPTVYQLCTLPTKKLPPEARLFQYFLIIYSGKGQVGVESYLGSDAYARLLKMPEIQALVDLSHIEPINQLLS